MRQIVLETCVAMNLSLASEQKSLKLLFSLDQVKIEF